MNPKGLILVRGSERQQKADGGFWEVVFPAAGLAAYATPKGFPAGKGVAYYVKPRFNETAIHFFFCKILENEIQKYTDHVFLYTTVKPDVVAFAGNKKICFEVETGTMEETQKKLTKEKYEKIKEGYTDYYILVTKRELKKVFEKYGKVMIRTEIKSKIKQLME